MSLLSRSLSLSVMIATRHGKLRVPVVFAMKSARSGWGSVHASEAAQLRRQGIGREDGLEPLPVAFSVRYIPDSSRGQLEDQDLAVVGEGTEHRQDESWSFENSDSLLSV